MSIIWTKEWQGSDDGTILKAIDLKNIQDDLSIVQTVNDALSIPSQTQGDVLYFNGSDWTRLAAGTAGQVLTTNGPGADPTFEDAVATDMNVTSQATGTMLYYDGANWVVLAPGTSGQLLTSNGVGVAPTYQDPPGNSYSNVIFSFIGIGDSSQDGNFGYGFQADSSHLPSKALTTDLYYVSGADNGAYRDGYQRIPWLKSATVSTLTYYFRVAEAGGGDVQTYRVYADTLYTQTSGIAGTATHTWRGPYTLDVSSLTTGTMYNLYFSWINNTNSKRTVACSGLIIWGS